VEDKDIAEVETLFEIAKTVGIPEDQARQFVEDRRGDQEDVAVKEYKQNLKEAEEIGERSERATVSVDRAAHGAHHRTGIFGTPTYVVNGELFWGQDRRVRCAVW
jgi:2-hydroxychromene-2-carboxylate isomerase